MSSISPRATKKESFDSRESRCKDDGHSGGMSQMDNVSSRVRSRMMSGIRAKNTRPELLVRKALHREGFRYRLHARDLPGTPDIVLPKYRAVVLINGCFWHGHDCHLFRWPASRTEFWQTKIEGNRTRDGNNQALLRQDGWRVMVIWECSIKGKCRLPFDQLVELVKHWIIAGNDWSELRGDS